MPVHRRREDMLSELHERITASRLMLAAYSHLGELGTNCPLLVEQAEGMRRVLDDLQSWFDKIKGTPVGCTIELADGPVKPTSI